MQEDFYKQEINLLDYFEILVKRKKVIFGILIISMFVSFVVFVRSYSAELRLCKISMVISARVGSVDPTGGGISLDSIKGLRDRILGKVQYWETIGKFNKDFVGLSPNIENAKPASLDILNVSTTQHETNSKLGIEMLHKVFSELHESYKKIIDYRKEKIDQDIASILSKIGAKEDEIGLKKKNIAILGKRLWKSSLNIEMEKERVDINKMERSIKSLRSDIEGWKLVKKNFYNIELLREPYISDYLKKFKKRKAVFAIMMSGLFVGIAIAFFVEFIEKNRRL